MGVSQNYGYHLRGPHNKDYSILGSILGSPFFGKLPHDPALLFLLCLMPAGGLRIPCTRFASGRLAAGSSLIIGTILGFYGDNGKENRNYYIGVLQAVDQQK